jgi:hypothetical protein
MNVTAVLPEFVQQRGKEELLEHCTPTGDEHKSDKGNRKSYSEVFHRCGELEMGRFSGQSNLDSRNTLELGKRPVQMDGSKKLGTQPFRVSASSEEIGASRAGVSPLTKKLGLSFVGQSSLVGENNNPSPFNSTLLDTSSLTEDWKNVDWSSSEEEGENENRESDRFSENKISDKVDREGVEEMVDSRDSGLPPYQANKNSTRNLIHSSSHPLFALRPYHFDSKDLSTKELEDTIRHSLSEANKQQTVSPPPFEQDVSLFPNQARANQSLESSSYSEAVPRYSMQRNACSTVSYSSNVSTPPAPWMTRWKTRMCKFYPMGMCKNGAKCSFAHSVEELREPESLGQPHAVNTGVQPCGNFPFYDMESSSLRGQKLDLYGSDSFHVSPTLLNNRNSGLSRPEAGRSMDAAKNNSDGSVPSSTSMNASNPGKSVPPAPWMTHFKTKMCKFFSAGECKNGDKCSFAHSLDELREPPPPEVNEERRRRYLRRQLQHFGLLNDRNSRFLPFSGEMENFSGQSMRGDLFANVDYLRMREQLPSSSCMYYRDIPKVPYDQSEASGMIRSSKKNMMYSLSSPQLGGAVDISNSIHRSSSYSFLELNSEVFNNNDLSNYMGQQSNVQYFGDGNAIHGTNAEPSSYLGAYSSSLDASTVSPLSSSIPSGSSSLSKALNPSTRSNSVYSFKNRKGFGQGEDIAGEPSSSVVSNSSRGVQQEDVWDEIDRDILHIVFDEDMESKSN